VGGGMAFTFFRAKGLEVGSSLLETDKLDVAKEILEEVSKRGVRFLLPVDCVVADKFENGANRKTVLVTAIQPGWSGLDIGPESVKLFKDTIKNARTIVWNGPMGVFEMDNFARGTLEIARALADVTKNGATTIVGGGDSAAALAKAGLEKAVSHVSTGGGASLEFLEGKVLPGIAALSDK